jgi:2,3-bisphosphoglycerate-independent phosphoglycerate mutase
MSAPEVTENLVNAIHSGKYDVIVCNYANADMVGHTGNFDAAVRAIEALDTCIGQVIDAATAVGGEILITADHGNAEQMKSYITEKVQPQPHTAHTTNLVPLVYIGREAQAVQGTGALCDIVPTLLHMMGLAQPAEMTGRTLFRLQESSRRAVAGG